MWTSPFSSMTTVQFSNFWLVAPSMDTPLRVIAGAAAAGPAAATSAAARQRASGRIRSTPSPGRACASRSRPAGRASGSTDRRAARSQYSTRSGRRSLPARAQRTEHASHAARFRAPEHLVDLEREPGVEAALEEPAREVLRVHLPPRRREQHRHPLLETVAPNHVRGPAEVLLGADDELHLVMRHEAIEVREVVGDLAGAGRLHVHDPDRRGRKHVERPLAVGLYRDLVARGDELLGEARKVLLQERLAAGEEDEPRRVSRHRRDDLVTGHVRPAVERVCRVAVAAAQVAAREAYEDARASGAGPLALDGEEDLGDPHPGVVAHPGDRSTPGRRSDAGALLRGRAGARERDGRPSLAVPSAAEAPELRLHPARVDAEPIWDLPVAEVAEDPVRPGVVCHERDLLVPERVEEPAQVADAGLHVHRRIASVLPLEPGTLDLAPERRLAQLHEAAGAAIGERSGIVGRLDLDEGEDEQRVDAGRLRLADQGARDAPSVGVLELRDAQPELNVHPLHPPRRPRLGAVRQPPVGRAQHRGDDPIGLAERPRERERRDERQHAERDAREPPGAGCPHPVDRSFASASTRWATASTRFWSASMSVCVGMRKRLAVRRTASSMAFSISWRWLVSRSPNSRACRRTSSVENPAASASFPRTFSASCSAAFTPASALDHASLNISSMSGIATPPPTGASSSSGASGRPSRCAARAGRAPSRARPPGPSSRRRGTRSPCPADPSSAPAPLP